MEKKRYHYFDFLRALAMLLGIPLHVAFAYTAIEYQWLVKDVQNSYIVDWGLYFLRIFRMPLFFIISGFFSHFMMHRNSQTFLIERTKRLLIPLLVLFLVIVCPLRVLWLLGEVVSGPTAFSFESFATFVAQNFFAATTSRFSIPASWGHLWFLLYLFIFSFLSFWLSKLPRREQHLVPLMMLTFVSFYFMESTWVDLPLGILPRPSLLFYYGLFYFYGWQSFYQAERSIKTKTSLMVLVIGILLGVIRAYLEVNSKLSLSHFPLSPAFLYALSTLSTWFISLGLIWSMKVLVVREYKIITFFVNGSYSIYLIHLPIIAILQLLVLRMSIHWSLKLMLVSSLTLMISSLIYRYLIQNRWPELFLKGKY